MKKKTKKKNNEKQKTIIIAIIIVVVVALVSGGTYSWWVWQSASANDTLVNVSPTPNSQLTITGTNVTNDNSSNTNKPGIMPISSDNCATSEYTLIGEATISATNGTATDMRVTPRLDVTLTPVSGRTLDNPTSNATPDLAYLHWAIVDTTSTTTKTCENPDYQGTFNVIDKVTVSQANANTDVSVTGPTKSTVSANTLATFNITNMSMIDSSATYKYAPTNYNTTSTLTFIATKNTITTKKYKVYVWLDGDGTPTGNGNDGTPGYEHTNIGTTISDPMQDLTISVKWSNKSSMIQE